MIDKIYSQGEDGLQLRERKGDGTNDQTADEPECLPGVLMGRDYWDSYSYSSGLACHEGTRRALTRDSLKNWRSSWAIPEEFRFMLSWRPFGRPPRALKGLLP